MALLLQDAWVSWDAFKLPEPLAKAGKTIATPLPCPCFMRATCHAWHDTTQPNARRHGMVGEGGAWQGKGRGGMARA